MIFVRDKGQMCNNMLQFAHLYAWGLEHGVRAVSLRFAYKYQYFKLCHEPWHHFATYFLVKILCGMKIIPYRMFTDEGDPTPIIEDMQHKRFVVIEGWHWFPECFMKHIDDIKRIFTFHPDISNAVDQQMQALEQRHDSRPAVRLGVHIRRGDYATWHEGRYFYHDEVYIRFIQHFIRLHSHEQVCVYLSTNDPQVNVEHFRKQTQCDAVFRLHNGPAEDLYMLAQCDYIIGPPSTFSLMGSFFQHAAICWMMSDDEQILNEGFKHFEDIYTHLI